MRVSIDKDDPGYSPLAVGPGIRVLLDGTERTHVVVADEEGRTLVRFATDERGRVKLNAARDSAERETLRGEVAILLPPHLVLTADGIAFGATIPPRPATRRRRPEREQEQA